MPTRLPRSLAFPRNRSIEKPLCHQLVVTALAPKAEIGAEVHTLDQFFRVEAGTGEAILDGVPTVIRAGFAVVVPAGANHNIINTGTVP